MNGMNTLFEIRKIFYKQKISQIVLYIVKILLYFIKYMTKNVYCRKMRYEMRKIICEILLNNKTRNKNT